MNIVRKSIQCLKKGFGFLLRLYNPRTWREKGVLWSIGLVIATYLLVITVLAIIWSQEPAIFDAPAAANERAGSIDAASVRGYTTAATVIEIAETLLYKPGGYLTNDVTPPGVLLDNMPSWEFGVITELREISRVLRNDFSRAQTQSVEDRDLMIADAQFHFAHNNWILPATEEEYKTGVNAMQRYLDRLTAQPPTAQFFPRADNLNTYLTVAEKRLGSLAQRLSANVRELRFNTEQNGGSQTLPPGEIGTNTPWLDIDNVFYEARGYVWALLHILKAIQVDFRQVLESKNAMLSLSRIIHKLERTQQPVWSPLIMNNSGFGMLTNHSLVMASYISRANSAITDLRILLMQN